MEFEKVIREERLKEHRHKLRNFQQEIRNTYNKTLIEDYKEYINTRSSLTFDELEVLRDFINFLIYK